MKLNIKAVLITAIAAICLFGIFRAVSYILEGEEGRLKRTVYGAKRLAETEDAIGLTNYISPKYYDELGNDRRMLLATAKTFFEEYRNILITIDSLEITIEDGTADCDIEATVYWQENNSNEIIYDTAKVKGIFNKERNRWRLIELKFFEPEKKRLFSPMVG